MMSYTVFAEGRNLINWNSNLIDKSETLNQNLNYLTAIDEQFEWLLDDHHWNDVT